MKKPGPIILFTLLMSAVILCSQSLEYDIDKPSALYIGTPFRINIEFETGLQDTIYSPVLDTLDIFILRDQNQIDTFENEKKITSLELVFQPFDTGEYTFPALEFTVKNRDRLQVLKTSEFQLNIRSTLADSSNVIRDIAGPVNLRLGIWDILLPLLIIVIIVLAAWRIRKMLSHRKKPEEEDPVTDDRPACLIALELLEKMKQKEYLQKGDFLNFYFELSFILRLFLELEYSFKALEMTTREIRNSFRIEDHKRKSEILDFLKQADKIKFARYIPDTENARKALEWLENFLHSYCGMNAPEDRNQEVEDA